MTKPNDQWFLDSGIPTDQQCRFMSPMHQGQAIEWPDAWNILESMLRSKPRMRFCPVHGQPTAYDLTTSRALCQMLRRIPQCQVVVKETNTQGAMRKSIARDGALIASVIEVAETFDALMIIGNASANESNSTGCTNDDWIHAAFVNQHKMHRTIAEVLSDGSLTLDAELSSDEGEKNIALGVIVDTHAMGQDSTMGVSCETAAARLLQMIRQRDSQYDGAGGRTSLIHLDPNATLRNVALWQGVSLTNQFDNELADLMETNSHATHIRLSYRCDTGDSTVDSDANVVLGSTNQQTATAAELYLPCQIPAVDHASTVWRPDGGAVLHVDPKEENPSMPISAGELPTVAACVQRLQQCLEPVAAVLICIAVSMLFLGSTGWAQAPITDPPSVRDSTGSSSNSKSASPFGTAQQREQLYQQLNDESDVAQALNRLLKRVAILARPTVVHIEARKTQKSGGRTESFDEAGSGVFVEIEGQPWVLTNRHVTLTAKLTDILVRTIDGRSMNPTKIVSDADTDIAVLKLPGNPIPVAKIGDSDSVSVGEMVIVIGSPFGLSHSVSLGVLSAKGRRDLSLGTKTIELQDFFQTDAAINPGNSGGPLLNLRGEVIALNTAIASSGGGSEGIGFAIPINMAMHVATQLVRHGQLRRSYLGVVLDPNYDGITALGNQRARNDTVTLGARVTVVKPDSPAALAGLKVGDIIIKFDGRRVDDDDHLVTQVG
ncbi:MAG: trypsin-like peptidase domain-containing protein, partial [Planctomycetota bacterium]